MICVHTHIYTYKNPNFNFNKKATNQLNYVLNHTRHAVCKEKRPPKTTVIPPTRGQSQTFPTWGGNSQPPTPQRDTNVPQTRVPSCAHYASTPLTQAPAVSSTRALGSLWPSRWRSVGGRSPGEGRAAVQAPPAGRLSARGPTVWRAGFFGHTRRCCACHSAQVRTSEGREGAGTLLELLPKKVSNGDSVTAAKVN